MAKKPKVSPEQLDEFRSLVFASMAPMLEDYIVEVRMSDDVDDKRKFLAWATTVVGADAKKEDNKPQLPVFNFSFALSGVQAQATQMVEVIDDAVEVATGAKELPAPEPTEIQPPEESMQSLADAFAQIDASLR